jgi:hypothetical protein
VTSKISSVYVLGGAILVLLFFGAEVIPQRTGGPAFRETRPFRYVVFENRIDPKIGGNDEDRREMSVLLQPKDFSRKTLTTLFKLILERFPTPRIVCVTAYTDLRDTLTPEEEDEGGTSEEPYSPPASGHIAVFIRNDTESFFYMYYKNGDFREVKVK